MIVSSNAFAPTITFQGLKISINAGSAYFSGANQVFSIPYTIVSLMPSTTNYVFLSYATGQLGTNTTGFPNQSYPIATVITTAASIQSLVDNRPDWVA